MIKWIIFDLDDTLLDTTKLLIPIAKTPQFYERIRQPLPLIEGAKENLDYLKSKYKLGLLTYGDVTSQQSKVQSLGIGSYFEVKYFADPKKSETKLQYFKKLCQDYQLTAGQFLSVGNRRTTDIRDAKLAGGATCLYCYGEHIHEKPEVDADHADFEIQSHKDLITVCKL